MNQQQPPIKRPDEQKSSASDSAAFGKRLTREFKMAILTVRRTLKGQESKASRPA
jgi:hypothetical protein